MVHPDDGRLEPVAGQLAAALRKARAALGGATDVLVGHGDNEAMKAAEEALHALGDHTDMLVPAELPSSSGVRAAVAMVHAGGDMERMAELIQQIAEIAWSRRTRQPMSPAVRSAVEAVGNSALALVERAMEAVELTPVPAVEAAAGLDGQLGEISRQQRVLDEVLVREEPQIAASDAVDVALLGRCYESCARHAVSAARHLAVLTS
jgi:phosphate transport system protein